MAIAKTKPLNGRASTRRAAIDQVVTEDVKGVTLAAIPDQRYFDGYISRDTLGGKKDLDIFDAAMKSADNVLLFGPTGPGKTSAVLAYAAREQVRFYSVACNLALDPTHMFGKWGQSETGLFQFYDGGITDIARHGGVVLLNEINFMSERIAPVLYEALDKRREITLLDHKGEKIRIHRPDCWCSLSKKECRKRWVLFVADMNPEYAGTRPLNHAMRNRFAIQIFWDYDDLVEGKLVNSAVLLDIAKNIRKQIGKNIDTPVSTNMLQEFVRFAADPGLGIGFAVANFCNHFTPDEIPAVKAVFDARELDLENDFKPDESEGYDQFDAENSAWMEEEDADDELDEELDEEEDEPW
jgi:MoxR-like ATPase